MQECPPIFYLQQAANHCCKAIATYIELWKNKDVNNFVHLSIDDVRIAYVSLARFRHDLKLLLKEGLVSFKEKNGVFTIELTAWDNDWDGDMAC